MIALFTLFFHLLGDFTTGSQYFDATLYENAASIFDQEGNRPKEVESLYLAGKSHKVIEKLEGKNPAGKELYFLALAYEDIGSEELMLRTKEEFLQQSDSENGFHNEELILQKANFYIKNREWTNALTQLDSLTPNPEVYAIKIQIKKELKASLQELTTLREALLSYPYSPFHETAAFELYRFQDYLMGERKAIVHLNHFVKQYPRSKFSIAGLYLIGLDLKKERRSEGKRRIHHQNLDLSVESFKESESLYEQLHLTFLSEEKDYWKNLYNRTKLEHASTLIEIGEQGNQSKKHIYFNYAAEILTSLNSPEATLLLIQVYLKDNDTKSALKQIEQLEAKLKLTESDKSSLLAKLYLEKGKLLYRQNLSVESLRTLALAEKFAPHLAFTADEELSLQIAKALCYKELKEYDQAMLTLSDVINSDLASSLRIKAMVMRALIYEMQERPELARRQFETAFLKGGEWAEKEKESWIKEFNPPY